MARRPKSPTRKPVSMKPAVPGAKAVPEVKPAAKAEPKVPLAAKSELSAKPMPFVIEPEATVKAPEPAPEPAPVPVTAKPEPVAVKPEPKVEPAAPAEPAPAAPVTAATDIAPAVPAPVETPPVKAGPVTIPVKSAPVESKPFNPSTPSQPVVAEPPLAAAMEMAATWPAPEVLEGNYIMNEAIETTKKFAEETKTRVQSMLAEMNDKAKAAMEKSSKAMEEIGDLTKGNLEAVVESSKIAAKGFETIGQNAAEYGRLSFEKTSATIKSFASVKSPAEFFQLQSELMTSTFDALASESAKTSEAMLKLAGEIAQPLSSRVAVVSDKFKALAA
jgi:phasin family protein